MSDFQSAKRAFSDRADRTHFIRLDISISAYNRILEGIKEDAFSMMLLFGPPGSGKSFMLRTIFDALKAKNEALLLETPPNTPRELAVYLYEQLLNKPSNPDKNEKELISQLLKEYHKKDAPIILLDEVQLYDEKILEFLRLVSDFKRFKFLLSLHKTKKEDIFAREYFSSRIWDVVELKRLTPLETAVYVQKRLLNHKLGEIASKINHKNAKIIQKLTLGNFRNINKIMYKTFDICDYFDKNSPTKMVRADFIDKKFIEMAAIELGMLRA